MPATADGSSTLVAACSDVSLRTGAKTSAMRKTMIEHYLDGRSPTLYEVPLERKEPTLWDKVVGHFQGGRTSKASVITLDKSPDLLDTLWGYYFATGSQRPIERIYKLRTKRVGRAGRALHQLEKVRLVRLLIGGRRLQLSSSPASFPKFRR